MNGGALTDCGCCEGLTAETPALVENRAGLSAIAYRCGTHAQFKQSMLAALSSSSRPALRALGTREDDDFSIALLDAWAAVSDVLTFYQERIANESYLRTATERLSLLQLARLIGYELRPGVAASVYLAFTLEDSEGSPRTTTIDVGTQVQSIPGPGEELQTFETSEKFEARTDFNSIRVPQTELVVPHAGSTHVYLKGTETNLKLGDRLLFVGAEREADPASTQWDIHSVTTIVPDYDANRTRVEWAKGLKAISAPQVFALRQRASLFGYNAPHRATLSTEILAHYLITVSSGAAVGDWPFTIGQTIDLDTTYSAIMPESWLVLSQSATQKLYRANTVTEASAARFAIAGKTTRIDLDTSQDLMLFEAAYRDTTVFAQSELLEIAEEPRAESVHGSEIVFDRIVEGLLPKQGLAISGKRARIQVPENATGLVFLPANGSAAVTLNPGDSLQVLSAPSLVPASGWHLSVLSPGNLRVALQSFLLQQIKWPVADRDGRTGSVTAGSNQLLLVPATKDDPTISEIAFIANGAAAITSDRDRTTVQLRDPLQGSYDRATFAINANVVLATHGETKEEVLGNGDASQPYQRFTLQESPLTFVHGSSPSGAASTLEVRVNDVLWHETSTLFGRGPRDRVFITRADDNGKTSVQFGDGVTGARLPSGQENVQATYRQGIGLAGLVKAGQLSLLTSPPLGVQEVTNPTEAAGADDRESRDDARENAPRTVLTLDRIVSLRDYEDFVRGYAGIAKALATWTWDGHTRGIFLTVAGPNGAEIKIEGDFGLSLFRAIRNAGDPFVPVQLKSYKKGSALFHLAARVKVDPDYETPVVLAAVESALRGRFSFDAREFGQPVASSEIIAVMQSVPGVIAVDLNKLYRVGHSPTDRLWAALPQPGASGTLDPAEVLVLDAAPLDQLEAVT
ncbi:MAG TPA: putative baseplate assembly protein [Chthoniobacterales bacterium]|nr:putative baseplate assembly protein [Chthoniobacterales bacterium]